MLPSVAWHTPGMSPRSLFSAVRQLLVRLRSEQPDLKLPALRRKSTELTAIDYVNFLLVMVPLGIVAGALNWSSTAVFTINFFAIIPLAAVLSFATEEISIKLGETMGGLLNATFGNAVELIVSQYFT